MNKSKQDFIEKEADRVWPIMECMDNKDVFLQYRRSFRNGATLIVTTFVEPLQKQLELLQEQFNALKEAKEKEVERLKEEKQGWVDTAISRQRIIEQLQDEIKKYGDIASAMNKMSDELITLRKQKQ